MLHGRHRPRDLSAARGSLTVVGTGIALRAQVTREAAAAIQRADEVLYLVTDRLAAAWVEDANPRSRSLHTLYAPGKERNQTYAEVVDELLEPVRAGRDVCAVFYGHPGVFVRPGHEAVRRARAEGFRARMLPAVSALDCLVADLGIDPAVTGLQSYEATEFVVHRRRPDTAATLVLWQIGVIGELGTASEPSRANLAVLAEHLERSYPASHETIVYEASPFPLVADPFVLRVPLDRLPDAEVPLLSTLVVPPARRPRRDRATMARLGLT
ncbi:MAG TPA: SAM-dependent methyltransferase [Gaiellaceae bacterium]|nr:SAM-dependent methyltransferase [Gaiellaceae bacterium]